MTIMHTHERIEQLVAKELKSLCTTCMHTHECVFMKASTRAIIQCELFQLDLDQEYILDAPKGLCKTCDNASVCKLPGRREGLWHCNEFR
jgi:hypothetical protein